MTGVEQLAGLLTGRVLWAVVLTYSVFPYAALWVVVRCWPKDDDRRRQYLADYGDVEVWKRPLWVGDVAVRSFLDGLAARMRLPEVEAPPMTRTVLHPHHWYGRIGPVPTSPRDTLTIVRTTNRPRLCFWDDHGDEWTIRVDSVATTLVFRWDADRARWVEPSGRAATLRRQHRAAPPQDGPGTLGMPFWDLPAHLRQRPDGSARGDA